MNTMIEEIRKRITAAIDYRDEAGDYDEYGSGQSVGLATALQIIDEVEKEHPVPADLEAEFKKWWENTDGKINIEHTMYWYMEDCARHFAEWERARIESELRLAWGKISMNPFDVDSVFRELLEHLKR